MTASAWVMLVATWAVVTTTCAWLFLKVLRTPQGGAGEDG